MACAFTTSILLPTDYNQLDTWRHCQQPNRYQFVQQASIFTTSIRHTPTCTQKRPRVSTSSHSSNLSNQPRPKLRNTTHTSKTTNNSSTTTTSTILTTIQQYLGGTPVSSLALLNLVTVLWGTQHSVIKLGVTDANSSPASLTFARFLLATIVSLPTLPGFHSPKTWQRGIEQGVYLFLGYGLQALALLTTTASRSAFLLYLNVKLVPLFARLLYGRKIAKSVWLSAGTAFLGTFLLAWDGSPPVAGDAFSLLAAGASALFILRMESAARECDAAPLNSVSLLTVAALSGIWSITSMDNVDNMQQVFSNIIPTSGIAIGVIIYLGIVTTALSNYIQAVGQRQVSAENAAVIFALDPVYGSIFAYWILGEKLGLQGFVGAGMIVIAAVMSAKGTMGRSNDEEEGEIGPLENEDSFGEDFDSRLKNSDCIEKRLREDVIVGKQYGTTDDNKR